MIQAHQCESGVYRPYPSLLCSACRTPKRDQLSTQDLCAELNSRASVAAPQLQETYEDPHPGYDCGGTCAVHGIAPKFNVPFEVWWKGQIARDFIQSALTDLEKISGPKLLAGEGSFAAEATAASAARRSLDSALSILDDAKRFGPSPVAVTVDAETKAKEIADYLFTNGFGDKGDHLNLYRNGDVYLGGWNEDSVVRGIVSYLNDHTAQSAPSDSSIQATAARHYFCSCGGALTAEEYIEHYFEKGHDRGDPELLIKAAAAEIVKRFDLVAKVTQRNTVITDEIAAILSKWLGAAAGGEQWLPIETVPKNGDEVLLAHANSQWLDQWISDITGDYAEGGYWMMCDQRETPEVPSHWKPLSDLPVAATPTSTEEGK